MTDLGTLGGTSSGASGINDADQVVGYVLGAGYYHAFLYQQSTGMVDLGALGGSTSAAEAVNNAGQVVGYVFPPSAGPDVSCTSRTAA